MPLTLTNQVASQALRGQSVKVTLDATDSAQLANISVGEICTFSGPGNTGTIYSIDTYGNSFKVIPIQPDKNCETTSGSGYVEAQTSVTI